MTAPTSPLDPPSSTPSADPDLQAWLRAARAARERCALAPTPVVRSAALSDALGCEVLLKLESLQPTGSFKLRGALAKLSAPGSTEGAVRTASTGNHGLAVVAAARRAGRRVVVHVPRGVDPAKRARLAATGAELAEGGADCLEAELAARAAAEARGEVFVSPYNDAEVVAGQGTLALELAEEVEPCDVVSVAVGGGGLIAGVGAVLRSLWPAARLVGASPERSPAMLRSVALGRIVPDEGAGLATLSDGTAGGVEEGALTFPLCAALVHRWVAVPEREIAAEMRRALLEDRLVVEGAAAVALAGLARSVDALRPARALVVVCGGNVSAEVLRRVLDPARDGGEP